MNEYIKRKSILHIIDLVMKDENIKRKGKAIRKRLKDLPGADVVSMETFAQVKWERDMALKTLEEHGIGLGQKVNGVVEVVRKEGAANDN